MFKPAILAGSAAVLIAHNHPSGDPDPSGEDVALTRRLASAGAILGIEVIDHIIVGEAGRFVSLKDVPPSWPALGTSLALQGRDRRGRRPRRKEGR